MLRIGTFAFALSLLVSSAAAGAIMMLNAGVRVSGSPPPTCITNPGVLDMSSGCVVPGVF